MAVIAAAIAIGLGGSSVLGGVTADWWDHRYAAGAAPLGTQGWQFAFLVAALPGFVLALLLWRLPEPKRGRIDGVESAPDPHPFRASLALLGAVAPVVQLARASPAARRGARDWGVNLAAPGAHRRRRRPADAPHLGLLTAAAAALRSPGGESARAAVERGRLRRASWY